jgi:hypothetical protein
MLNLGSNYGSEGSIKNRQSSSEAYGTITPCAKNKQNIFHFFLPFDHYLLELQLQHIF